MYDRTPPPPPSRPGLLKIALDDLERAGATGGPYVIDVGTWHSGEAATLYRPARCAICLAGAVMAMRLEAPVDEIITPGFYPDSWRRSLEAIDALRCGEVEIAADIGDPVEYPVNHIKRLIHPEMSNAPEEWIAEWRDVQFALEAAVLLAEGDSAAELDQS